MRTTSRFEDALLESGSIMRRGYSIIRENSGKLIALITAILAILLTFAEVGLPSVIGTELGADIIVMLVASYIIFFSLESAGERLGRDTDAYKDAERIWREKRKEVGGESIGALRDFCIRYSADELDYRRRAALMAAGLTESDYKSYTESLKDNIKRSASWVGKNKGEGSGDRATPSRREGLALRRISKMKPIPLSPTTLLGGSTVGAGSELKNPERHKLIHLIIGLLPSTVCMLFTVSMMMLSLSTER